MNVVVDVGNTRVKYAFFSVNGLQEMGFGWLELLERLKACRKSGQKLNLLLSGSGHIPEEKIYQLKEWVDSFMLASIEMPLPLEMGYLTPTTLGFDRIANCVGAMKLFPRTPLLVIDSGTCVTFNYVSGTGVFVGGNISPGVELRFKSLHEHTAKLPYLSPDETFGGIGKHTEEAMCNGVMLGMLYEIQNYIHLFKKENVDGKIVLTGGNAHFFKSQLPEEIHGCDFLGLIGLNEILQYSKIIGD